MARVLITGSTTGLGLRTAQILAERGNRVVLHARNAVRAAEARTALPQAEDIVVGDLETMDGAQAVAEAVNTLGRFDAVIHNAGAMDRERHETADGHQRMFAVNVLAPYILSARMTRPDRLIYLSSSMHRGADADLTDVMWRRRRWSGSAAYSESKLLVHALAFAVARLYPSVRSNAVDPGWVATRMGGPGAPDDLDMGCETQATLAAPPKDSPLAQVTGTYVHYMTTRSCDPQCGDIALQDALLALCAELSDVSLSPSDNAQ